MSIHNILVAFNGSDSSVSAVKYAAFLASHNGAHVTVLLAYTRHQTIGSRGAWIPREASAIMEKANAEIINAIEEKFEQLRNQLGLGERLHFQRESGRIDALISEAARSFDIVIMGQPLDEEVDAHVLMHPDRIALMSGRPVIIIPTAYNPDSPHSHAVLAWDGGRAAARSLYDSLQLLEDQGKVSVITIDSAEKMRPISEVLDHLQRHGIAANHQHLDLQGAIADTLLKYCAEKDPCLLVMGAYEHSKFREDFLGGVTAEILRRSKIPVLLSH